MLRIIQATEPVVLAPFFAPRIAAMRVPDEIRKCILFVGIKDKDGNFLPRATAFFVSIFEHQHQWNYVVTAQHVVSGLLLAKHDIWIRNNNKEGRPIEMKVLPEHWSYGLSSPDGLETDVAVVPVVVTPDEDVLAVALNGPQSLLLTEKEIAQYDIGVGDEIHIAGLFRIHYGRQKNVPIIRVGNIAMMEGEPVWTRYCGYVEAHLIEAMSIGGLSGSPVFVNIGLHRIIKSRTVATSGRPYLFLGLMHGHFDIKNLNEDVVDEDETASLKGVHTGIGVVIPARKIVEIIFHPEQSEMRRKLIEKHREKDGAIADVISEEPLSSDSDDANPNHQADFTRLVDVAARRRPQGDQT
jgi:DNA-binding transcriptional regulator of glucitol operon